MDLEVIKSGWLFRQSSILKRWKRCWFVLYRDGLFKYYMTPDQNTAEAAISTTNDISDVISEVKEVTPPSNLGKECLFSVTTNDGETWTMCAESSDDKKAWEMSLNDARLTRPFLAPPPYTQMSSPPPYYNNPVVPYAPGYQYPQQTTIVYADQPHYYRRRRMDGNDMAMGMVAGAALGSLVWGPLLWW